MAAELEQLALIADEKGLHVGASLIRANAQVLFDEELIPSHLETSVEVAELDSYKAIGKELSSEGFTQGAILINNLGKSLIQSGLIEIPIEEKPYPLRIRRRAGSVATLVKLDLDSLRTHRVGAQLSLRALARESGLSVAFMSRLERGDTSGRLNPISAEAIAKTLGVDLEEIKLKDEN